MLVSLLCGCGNVLHIMGYFLQSLRKFTDTKVSVVLVLGVSIFVDSSRLIVCW